MKKPFVLLLGFLLVLDMLPSLSLVHGGLKFTAPEKRYEAMEDSTLIGKAKEITNSVFQCVTFKEKEINDKIKEYIINKPAD